MKQRQLEWRRQKILESLSEGYSRSGIRQKLQLDRVVVHRDIHFLKQQAQQDLQRHIHETIPEEYQNCMVGIKRNLRQTLEIAETASDPRTKVAARAIVNDCYKFIIELTTNGVVKTDAIKFVQTNKEKLTMSMEKEGNCEESDCNRNQLKGGKRK
jgi:hypothetical protein